MATVGVTFGDAAQRGEASIFTGNPGTSEVLTSSASSASTTATTDKGQFVRIAPLGNIHAIFGNTAATSTGYVIASGSELVLYDANGGNKVSVIDA